jgi:hypothetical protein
MVLAIDEEEERLMALLEIYFFGLISHTRLDKKTKRSALVYFPNHEATIYTSSTRSQSIGDGAHIRFKGLGSKPILSPYFSEYVPSLMEVISPGYDLRDDVKSGKNRKEVQAFVNLPSGYFDVADFYKYPATFYLNFLPDRKNCVGRLTLLTCAVDDDNVTVSINGTPLTVQLPGWVLFANASNVNADDPHFKAYRSITTAPNIATVEEDQTDVCPLWSTWHKGIYYDKIADIVKSFRDAGQVECTNTRWP